MKTIERIITLSILTAVTAGAAKPLNDSQIGPQKQDPNRSDASDVSEYYGFGEMEIIKLDYGIQNLLVRTLGTLPQAT